MLCFSNQSFAQYIYEDTNQPDSIYKINKVRSRTMQHSNDRISIVYHYDIYGKLTEELHLLNNSKLLTKRIFSYDSNDRLIKEEDQLYASIDTSRKDISSNFIKGDSLHSLVTSVIYNDSGELIRKTMLNFNGEKISEILFTYNPYRRIEKLFNLRNGSYDETTTEYDKPNIAKHLTSYHITKDQSLKVTDINISNYFDPSGKLIKRIVLKELPVSTMKRKEESYEYNSNGLLLKKVEKRFYPKNEKTTSLLIEYTYW